jgi:hypothetical protein
MIFLDGVYLPVEGASPVFRHVSAPTAAELQELVQRIAERIGKVLEQRGLVERDMENAWLATQGEGGPRELDEAKPAFLPALVMTPAAARSSTNTTPESARWIRSSCSR